MKFYRILTISLLLVSILFSNTFEKKDDKPLTYLMSSSDKEWLQCIKDAQKTFDKFQKLYSKYKETAGVSFFIKIPLVQNGKTHHYWFYFDYCKENLCYATYTELPDELMMYKNIKLEKNKIEDWMIKDRGYLYGGYSLRLQRSRLSENQKKEFDNYIGIKKYVDNKVLNDL
jgi:uncharacterized protein YegJ (DUF2314 family)